MGRDALVPSSGQEADLETLATVDDLIRLVGNVPDGDNPSCTADQPTIVDRVRSLSAKKHEDLWSRVVAVAGQYLSLEKLLPQGGHEIDATAEGVLSAVSILLATFAEEALDASKNPVLPNSFVEVANLCQEMLLSLPNRGIQANIARALEKVSTNQFNGSEEFCGGILMFLLGRCVEPKVTSAEVTRLYKVRELLRELDWDHESIESLKLQLMCCTRNPGFVRSNRGPDMLAHFYVVHPGFTSEVHSTVKNQVMYARSAVLKSYAVGLFRAWKMSEGGTRVQIEHCVQEWAALAIRSARKSADKARAMLEEFHNNRHADDNVNELLCRLYGPLLWRCLKVANWQVRQNAARLLQYTFELCPRDMHVADKEQELNRQLRLLRETLEDPSEPVRRVGCGAVCVILKTYWDIMPPGDTALLLSKLADQCARDRKAPMVRAAVAEGFGLILDNPKSHQVMESMVPKVSDMLNDRAPIVRAAFVKLLRAVHRCKGFASDKVVALEALLNRLAAEQAEAQAELLQRGSQAPKKAASGQEAEAEAEGKASPEMVAKLLAQLLAPSLFQKNLVEQVVRCDYLMKNHPLPLLALLMHAKSSVEVHTRVRLAAGLFQKGLRDAEAAALRMATATLEEQRRMKRELSMLLRVVGVLLEGASQPAKRARRKGAHTTGRFPKELEAFVYECFQEEKFLPLFLGQSEQTQTNSHSGGGEDTEDLMGKCAEVGSDLDVRDQLLFAISSLDPSRLPETAELIKHELTLACRGTGEAATYAAPRLSALLKLATRWGMLDTCLAPAWERLRAASSRLKQRQAASNDTADALTVVEAVFRDQLVRSAVLPSQAVVLEQIAKGITSAFQESWNAGLKDLQKGQGKSTTAPLSFMGPAAPLWPRVLGLILRIALHLEHRLAPAPAQASRRCTESAEAGEEQEDAPAAAMETGEAPTSGPSLPESLLTEVAQLLTSDDAQGTLANFETLAKARNPDAPSQPAKKRAKGQGPDLPADVDEVMHVHRRLLEALNAAHLLSVSRRGAVIPVLSREIELRLWRWATVADTLRPSTNGLRATDTWVFLGRVLQQMVHADIPTPHLIEALVRLLTRVSDETPASDDELKRPLHTFFNRMEFEPLLVKTLVAVLSSSTDATGQISLNCNSQEGEAVGTILVHERARKAILELVPFFRNLRARLLPDQVGVDTVGEPPASPRRAEDRRRVLASPTPQKSARGPHALTLEALRHLDQSEDGRRSLGQRSFSVRSRSPRQPIADGFESLRQSCVGGPDNSQVSEAESLDLE